MKKIGVFVGSLRKGSFNRSVAEYLAALVPDGYQAQFFDIGGLQLYNQDLDENPPQAWVEFRAAVKELDAFLFVTPEYNRSIPGVLKNALDVGSRPYGQSVWSGKPGGVVSVSPGAIGGFGANHHLRQVLSFLNVYALQQPEAYIGNATSLLDKEGNVVNEDSKTFFKNYIERFIDWIEKF